MAEYTREVIEKEPENGWKTREAGKLTVKIEVDCDEAITGLKAIQREAREAVRALRELEQAKRE